ncbi:MAG: amidohydrolase family protein, partial [Desulfuromonadales bacterium]|nr:amidohydrolase family protein [Desulfuromonadales bacterium]
MLNERAVKKYLAHIEKIKTAHELIDVHVHPFEVLYNNLSYKKNPDYKGVYSSNITKYGCPDISEISDVAKKASNSCRRILPDEIRHKCLLLTMRQLYLHTGPQVFIDQMLLSGVDRVLLLPVSSEGTSMDEQMTQMAEMFGHDDRFAFGFSVPYDIKNNQVKAAIDDAVKQYAIKAIKLHPAISDINLQERDGLERVESILRSCREHGLSIIIHGGKSPDIKETSKTTFGELCNLDRVDWSLSGNPVVIAHAGVYGCRENTFGPIIQRLQTMMAKHDN